MSRSPVSTLSLVLFGCLLSGCTAQEERRSLQNTVQRLEQSIHRMDDYVRTLQSGQAQQQQERDQALKKAEAELARLREVIAAHQREAQAMTKEAAELRQELQRARGEGKEAAELRQELQRVRGEAKEAQQRAGQLQKQAEEQKGARAEFETQLQHLRKGAEQKVAEAHKQAEQAERAAKAGIEKARAEVEELRRQVAATQRKAEQRGAELEKKHQEEAVKARREAERRLAAMQEKHQDELQQPRQDAERRHAEQDRLVAALHEKCAELAAQLERAKQAPQPDDERQRERARLLDRLAAERREIRQLREEVARDLDLVRQRSEDRAGDAARLRQENEDLRRKLQALEARELRDGARELRTFALQGKPGVAAAAAKPAVPPAPRIALPAAAPAPAPAAPAAPPQGTIIVNNGAGGEVHFHFHGNPPMLVTAPPSGVPGRAPGRTEPAPQPRGAAVPAEPRRMLLQLQEAAPAKAPAQRAIEVQPAKKKQGERKINAPEPEADAIALGEFVQALLGSF
ncbi:MAG: hypothetical protein FJ265_01830 [Planctomycetes bacterium]|nr:hypothetical protein [Planctomycetota bacterium]